MSNQPRAYSAHDLMGEILDMTNQRWIDQDRFRQILTKMRLQDSQTRIYFLTQLHGKIRLIPMRLFPSPEAREKMLDALQEAMDLEIAREE
ncbi:MAG: TyeA family type III secretion system gatekeeper subunit [Verrucomicrobiales bacterium]|nr:TyeA family type III secretion system gatekeeper subunit [bacterium]MDF2377651.1 TyeA family type III secretion system gatekeeper subunit [Verrucomicrobiales bacterium]